MDSVGDFITILSIMGVVSLVIIVATIISVAKSGDKLTSFEKKVLIFVAIALCLGIMMLYIFSNLEVFKAAF
ncbi:MULTISPECIES: hypothetical protein [Helicobacter]|uniref:Uncharacterized protein n=1 Tax=Helicobacter ibis TaxID=2962633 RepID=A0ABT4VEG4_9HELI|nr:MULTISPECIES: hypothetical protein [Helicobacter]MDA3967463.1 hypothetical protein [Helicobacter sp. WB40]MDA3969096.1 hypothetical protein [Helicobacter ibis]